jgi:hypothetical protein
MNSISLHRAHDVEAVRECLRHFAVELRAQLNRHAGGPITPPLEESLRQYRQRYGALLPATDILGADPWAVDEAERAASRQFMTRMRGEQVAQVLAVLRALGELSDDGWPQEA